MTFWVKQLLSTPVIPLFDVKWTITLKVPQKCWSLFFLHAKKIILIYSCSQLGKFQWSEPWFWHVCLKTTMQLPWGVSRLISYLDLTLRCNIEKVTLMSLQHKKMWQAQTNIVEFEVLALKIPSFCLMELHFMV